MNQLKLFHHFLNTRLSDRLHPAKYSYVTWMLVCLFIPATLSAQQPSSAEAKAIPSSLNEILKPVRNCLSPDAAAEPDPVCAKEILDLIDTQALQSYERAEIWNLYGYTYYRLQIPEQSLEYYKQVVSEEGANAPLKYRTLKTIAQLSMVLERYESALDYYQQWLDKREALEGKDHALMATIYYNMDKKDAALEYIEKAIATSESEGQPAQENWYSLQRSLYYQRKDCARTLEIVQKLQSNYPSEKYLREIEGMENAGASGCTPSGVDS